MEQNSKSMNNMFAKTFKFEFEDFRTKSFIEKKSNHKKVE